MPTQIHTPKLSVVVTARNDDHGGNMLHRMEMFIGSLEALCVKHGLPTELVVVDWNPPQDATLLHEALSLPKSSEYFSMRFIEVSPEVHQRFGNAGSIKLYQFIGKNVGIRRARGEWIVPTNLDILFSEDLVRFMAAAELDPDTFYRADRCDTEVEILPDTVAPADRTAYCMERMLRVHSFSSHEVEPGQDYTPFFTRDDMDAWGGQGSDAPAQWRCDVPFENASGDYLLMHTSQWERLRGYPELDRSDVYIDALLVNMALAEGMHQVVLPYPMCVCHIEHRGSWIRLSKKESPRKSLSLNYETEFKPWCEQIASTKSACNPNPETWGLVEVELKERGV